MHRESVMERHYRVSAQTCEWHAHNTRNDEQATAKWEAKAAEYRTKQRQNAYRPDADEIERGHQFDDRLAMFRAEY